MACPYGAIYMDPESNTADKCTYCAHRIESSMMPACVVACPVEANIFGDLEDPHSNISKYISKDKRVQVRKPEKNTQPKHFYVGGGQAQLNPQASLREEGYSLFNNITHLKHIGKGH
jgi:Fe-S-cluster-containing dehydrogenase component